MAPGLIRNARYWAGQKLLHSQYHDLYLKIIGKSPLPPGYDGWLKRETHGPAVDLDTSRFRMVTEPGVRVASDAAHWLMAEAERTGAARVYADEDQMEFTWQGYRRHSPVFRPQWSPELAANCDYMGGCYLERIGTGAGEGRVAAAHVPRVLFHRTRGAREYSYRAPARDTSLKPGLTEAVICSRNAEYLDQCLGSLRASGEGLRAVVVLHMGQGQDDALRQVAERHGARAIEYTGPFHFSRMCNAAVETCSGELVLFLNDDVTAPAGEPWLEHMQTLLLTRPGAGAIGALLDFPDGRIQHAGVMIGTAFGAGHPGRLGNGSAVWPWVEMTRDVMAVTGACLLCRRDLFRELGGFDEFFPINHNDIDFCLRVRRAGYRILLSAEARLTHAESASRKPVLVRHELDEFERRWREELSLCDPFFSPHLSDNEELLPEAAAWLRPERIERRAWGGAF